MRKLIPLLVLLSAAALILSRRKSSNHQPAAVGTAPAGAPPKPERDPARATPQTNSRVEPTPPTATPATTSGAMMGVSTPASAPDVANQPSPIATDDAPGSFSSEELAETSPDLAAWVALNQGDNVDDDDATDGSDATDVDVAEAASDVPETEEADDASEADDAATDRDADDETGGGDPTRPNAGADPTTVPTPAAESTDPAANEGRGWIEVSGDQACPPDFPIKGNANSRIYHMPGSRNYEVTIPEICFASEEAATARGFRAPKG